MTDIFSLTTNELVAKLRDGQISSAEVCSHYIERIKKSGLAKGGSLQNAVVVDNDKVLNEGGLRNEKEFVNHKILDCMRDLYLSGYKIIGSLKCSQGGHSLTNRLLRKVFSDKNNYTVFEIKEKSLPHTFIDKSILKSIA